MRNLRLHIVIVNFLKIPTWPEESEAPPPASALMDMFLPSARFKKVCRLAE